MSSPRDLPQDGGIADHPNHLVADVSPQSVPRMQ